MLGARQGQGWGEGLFGIFLRAANNGRSYFWQRPRAGRGEEGVGRKRFGRGLRKPFINLSSVGAFVRQLFASREAIAGIKINKIRSDCMATNQKVGSSTLSGRTTKSITQICRASGR